MTRPEPIAAVVALVELLASGYEPVWARPQPNPDGSRPFPWVDYDPRVRAGLAAALELAGSGDVDYLDHIAAVRERPEDELTLPELATWLTWVSRGERFSEGHIAAHIGDGSLERCLARLLTLIAARGDAEREEPA